MCARRVESIGQSFARSTAALLLLAGCGADFARARGGLARVIYECEVTGQLGARALAQVQVGKKFRGDGMQIASRAYRPSMSYACTLQVERSRSRTVVLSGRHRRPRHRARPPAFFLLRPPGPVRMSLAGCLVRYLTRNGRGVVACGQWTGHKIRIKSLGVCVLQI